MGPPPWGIDGSPLRAELLKRAGKIKKAKIAVSVEVPGGDPATATSSGTLVVKR